MDREIMTVKGSELLREELKKLKSVDRPEIITAIATAREFGDLKENAEYHAAKEKQSFIEGRISEIELKLSNSEVIDINKLSISNKEERLQTLQNFWHFQTKSSCTALLAAFAIGLIAFFSNIQIWF